ncbi:MAG: efflux RND transporter periplasmic adaptor subunit [Gemmataceae bacterium]|nr:efflux RND transporter periplasmic adaptor subunit [Gemmataceae bacterium]
MMTLHPLLLRRLPLLVAMLVACAVAGCRRSPLAEEESGPQAPVRAQAARKVAMGEWTELLGTTQPLPNHSAHVSATVEGHVTSVLSDDNGSVVVEGQQVQAGQVIVRLDDRVLRANRDRLQATQEDLEEQQKQAGYALELAAIDVNRLQGLLKGSPTSGPLPLVSRVELEKAHVLQKDAQSKLKAVAAKQAALRADLKALDKQLEFYTLRAPITGRLGIVHAVPGQTLSPGTMVADVVDLREIDVLCYVPPDAAARLALDQRTTLLAGESTASEPTDPLRGTVVFIGVQAQPETGNIAVKVRFPNPGLRLRAHAIARVKALTQPERERLTIPEAALGEDRDIPTVVVVEDVKTETKAGEEQTFGKARKLQVALGIRDRGRHIVEILGLQDPTTHEKVALDGLLFVTHGGHGLKNEDVVKLLSPQESE